MHTYTYMCVWNQTQKSVTKCSIHESIVSREQAVRPGFECQVFYVKVASTGRLWNDVVSFIIHLADSSDFFHVHMLFHCHGKVNVFYPTRWHACHSCIGANAIFLPTMRIIVRWTRHSCDFTRTRFTVFSLMAHEQQVGEVCVLTSFLSSLMAM